MQRNDIVKRISVAAQESLPQASVWLYGSEARGDARDDSDIDLLVLFNTETLTFRDRMEVSGAFLDIEQETGIEINTYIDTEKGWNAAKTVFRENVTKERIAL